MDQGVSSSVTKFMSLFSAGCLKWSVIKELSLEIINYSLQRVISFSSRWLLLLGMLVRAEPRRCSATAVCCFPLRFPSQSGSWLLTRRSRDAKVNGQEKVTFARTDGAFWGKRQLNLQATQKCKRLSRVLQTQLSLCDTLPMQWSILHFIWQAYGSMLSHAAHNFIWSFFFCSFSVEWNILFSPVIIAR